MDGDNVIAKEPNYGYLYETYCHASDMFYIGIKCNEKFLPRYLGSGIKLQNAVNVYGWHWFRVRLLSWATSRDHLELLEIATIAAYREKFGKDRLYNIAKGGYSIGDAVRGTKITCPIALARMSVASKRRMADPIIRAKVFLNRDWHNVSTETREKIGVAHRGKKLLPEHIAALNAGARRRKGRSLTPEHLANVRAAAVGRKPSRKAVEAARAAHLGKPRPQSSIDKMKATIAKRIAAGLPWGGGGQIPSQATIDKQSAVRKKAWADGKYLKRIRKFNLEQNLAQSIRMLGNKRGAGIKKSEEEKEKARSYILSLRSQGIPWGMAKCSPERRREIARMGAAASNAKRRGKKK